MALQLHRLTAESLDLKQKLPIILKLSNDIFQTDPTSKYASLSLWRERISRPGAVIVYAAASAQEDSESVDDSQACAPFAFLFCHPRHHDPPLCSGASETPHIWLAGVLLDQRSQGLLDKMIRASELESGNTQMTVCTTPETYPRMWSWLLRRNWTVERELSGGKVLLSKSGERGAELVDLISNLSPVFCVQENTESLAHHNLYLLWLKHH